MQESVNRLFQAATISTAYGMTEAASSITFHVLHTQQPSVRQHQVDGQSACQTRNGIGVCVGWPAPGVQVSIDAHSVDSFSGSTSTSSKYNPPSDQLQSSSGNSTDTPVGAATAIGEVLTRGPHVMTGYWQDPDATAKVSCSGFKAMCIVLIVFGAHFNNLQIV